MDHILYFIFRSWPMRLVERLNKLKDVWLESAIRLYAEDVRERYPLRLSWYERIFAPLIVRRYTGTIANLISIIRLLMAIIVFLLIIIGHSTSGNPSIILNTVALILFILAGLLDLLDGPAARALEEISESGKVLDPLADKMLLAAPFLVLGFFYLPTITYWAIIFQESFLILIAVAKLMVKKLPFTMATQASMAGKIKNIFELVAGGFLFICPFGNMFIIVSNVLFIISIPIAYISIIGYLSSVRMIKK